jgi:ACT domain-containing protein
MTTFNVKNEDIQKVRDVIRSHRGVTIREVAQEVGISKTTCHEFTTENLGMHRVAAVYVLHLLSEDRKQTLVDISKEFVDRAYADK